MQVTSAEVRLWQAQKSRPERISCPRKIEPLLTIGDEADAQVRGVEGDVELRFPTGVGTTREGCQAK